MTNEYNQRRDFIRFPIGMPSNMGNPQDFNDRIAITTRKDKYQPVQHEYMQQYRLEQMQGQFQGYFDNKQLEVNQQAEEPRIRTSQRQLERNFEDAVLYQHNMQQQGMPIMDRIGGNTRKTHEQMQIPNEITRTIPQGEYMTSGFDYNNLGIDRMQYQRKQ